MEELKSFLTTSAFAVTFVITCFHLMIIGVTWFFSKAIVACFYIRWSLFTKFPLYLLFSSNCGVFYIIIKKHQDWEKLLHEKFNLSNFKKFSKLETDLIEDSTRGGNVKHLLKILKNKNKSLDFRNFEFNYSIEF